MVQGKLSLVSHQKGLNSMEEQNEDSSGDILKHYQQRKRSEKESNLLCKHKVLSGRDKVQKVFLPSEFSAILFKFYHIKELILGFSFLNILRRETMDYLSLNIFKGVISKR